MALWLRLAGLIGLIGLIVTGLVACGPENPDTSGARRTNEPPPTEVFGMEVDPVHLQGPGTELGDGMKVSEGSWLVGTVFPQVRPPELDLPSSGIENGTTSVPSEGATPATPKLEGWIAWILISGDPIDVWTRYVDQLGLSEAASATKACVVRAGLPETTTSPSEKALPPSERVLTEPRLEHEVSIRCSSGLPPQAGPTDRSVRLDLVRAVGIGSCPGAWGYAPFEAQGPSCRGGMSFLEIEVSHLWNSDSSPLPGESSWRGRQMDALVPPVATEADARDFEAPPLPKGPILSPSFDEPEPSPLPTAGEDFGTEDYQLDFRNISGSPNPLVVPDSGSLVVPSRDWPAGGCTGSLRAVFHFDGDDPRALLGTLLASLDASPITSVSDGGREVFFAGTTSAGGAYLDVELVPTGQTSGYVRIADCGD